MTDVLILQETHSNPENEEQWTREWGGKAIFSHGTSNARGICMLFKKQFVCNIDEIQRDLNGRYLACNVTIIASSFKIALCSLYAPNEDKPIFYEALDQNISELHWNKLIIGDFNLVLDVKKDRYKSTHNNSRACERLKQMIEDLNLSDTWRTRHPNDIRYSWQNHQKSQASRIDFFLLSTAIEQLCENCMYMQGIMSDHSAIYLSIKDIVHERGPGYWKANASLLNIPEISSFIIHQLQKDRRTSQELDPIERWITLKKRIIKYLKQAARRRADEKRLLISQLAEKITLYEETFPLNQHEFRIYNDTVCDFNTLLEERAKSIIFRSRVKWAEQGEKSTKYFLNMEKMRGDQRSCKLLIKDDGTTVETLKEIMEEQSAFYAKLYTSNKDIKFTYLNSTGIRISEKSKDELNMPLSCQELKEAVMCLAKDKSPGLDGLPAEVYQLLWNEIDTIMFEAYEEIFKKGKMYEEAMNGVLNLIPKQNKDSRFLKNLRPITLLNVDYKIIEKVIARRIQRTLQDIINIDQAGFMAGRRAAVVVRKIFDIMNFCERNNEQAIVLSLDYMKAFDCVELDSILGSLSFFGFPEYILKWVRILYTGFTVQIQNSGHLSEKIKISRSVHQGGCASAFLFIVLVEALAIAIREDHEIEGLIIRNSSQKINQFADDTSIVSPFKQENLDRIMQKLEWFSQQSGLMISYEKTEIYRIGSLQNSSASLYTQKPISWTNEGLKILGIHISHHEDCVEKNFLPTIDKMANILKSWQTRNITLIGKVTVINSLIASLFIHKLTVLPNMPKSIVRKFNTMMVNFLWNEKRPKIPTSVLQLSKKSGGLGLTDIERREMALKITWIQIVEQDIKCATMLYCVTELGANIFRCNIDPKDVESIVPRSRNAFWHDVLYAWTTLAAQAVDNNNVAGQMIWWNRNVKIQQTAFCWRKPYQKGLLWVSQLYHNQSLISAKEAYDKYALSLMEFHSVVSAIPSEWRKQLKEKPIKNSSVYDKFVNTPNLSKVAYTLLQTDTPTYERKLKQWSNDLNYTLAKDEWLRGQRSLYFFTNITKYRSFEYRLMHRALVLNSHPL